MAGLDSLGQMVRVVPDLGWGLNSHCCEFSRMFGIWVGFGRDTMFCMKIGQDLLGKLGTSAKCDLNFLGP